MTGEGSLSRESGTLLGKAPLIGRVNERETIMSAVGRSVTDSRAELVTVVGNPGVGKTRLMTETIADLRDRLPEARAYRGACRPEAGIQAALAKILRARLGLGDSVDPATQAAEMR